MSKDLPQPTAQLSELSKQPQLGPSKFQNVFPRTINPTHPADIKLFEKTCAKLYEELVEKDCKSWNYPSYHACCNTFSKKREAKADIFHTASETCSLGTWLKYHKVEDQAKFCEVLLQLVRERKDEWFTLPGLNLSHNCDYPKQDNQTKIERATEMLQKRASHAEAELENANQRIAKLEQRLEAERKGREQDQMKFDLILVRLKKEGRLLQGPEPNFKPLPKFSPDQKRMKAK
jgi:hypothetical protein